MKLAKALDDKKMDSRVVDRLLSEGKISKTEFDKHMSDLPDEEGNFTFVGSQEEAPVEEAPASEITE